MMYKINLTQNERFLVGLIKNHHKQYAGDYVYWHLLLLKPFSEIYGFKFEPEYRNELQMFKILLEILNKISENKTYETHYLFDCIFDPNTHSSKTPIEKGIAALCGLIQGTVVKGRFTLKIKAETKKMFYESTKHI